MCVFVCVSCADSLLNNVRISMCSRPGRVFVVEDCKWQQVVGERERAGDHEREKGGEGRQRDRGTERKMRQEERKREERENER